MFESSLTTLNCVYLALFFVGLGYAIFIAITGGLSDIDMPDVDIDVPQIDLAPTIDGVGSEGEWDLAGYRIYRGASADFAPGPATFVAAVADTGHVDAAGGPPLTLCEATNGKGGAWGAHGDIVFAPTHAAVLHRVSETGGDPTPVPGTVEVLDWTGPADWRPLAFEEWAASDVPAGLPVVWTISSSTAFGASSLSIRWIRA
mgnify:CR=1 FL=1